MNQINYERLIIECTKKSIGKKFETSFHSRYNNKTYRSNLDSNKCIAFKITDHIFKVINIPIYSSPIISSSLKSIITSLLLLLVIVTINELVSLSLEKSDFQKLYGVLFAACFVYFHTLFNNQWKYTADLYNKIHFDVDTSENAIIFLRKRMLLFYDIDIQNLGNHDSFFNEYNSIITCCAYLHDELNLTSDKKAILNDEATIILGLSPIYIIDKVSAFNSKQLLNLVDYKKILDSSDSRILELEQIIESKNSTIHDLKKKNKNLIIISHFFRDIAEKSNFKNSSKFYEYSSRLDIESKAG